MSIFAPNARSFALVAAAMLLPAASADAQYYSSYRGRAPVYPYSAQAYAIEVAPNTYVIRRPADSARARRASQRVERHVVREKPVVIEHKRIVDDPPRVIERQIVVDDPPTRRGLFQHRSELTGETPLPPQSAPRAPHATAERPASKDASPLDANAEQRVIKADAEITILGPDRMSIRLFRKRGAEANARAR
jgi:hypothetical protein